VYLTVYPVILLAAVLWGMVPGALAGAIGQLASDFLFVQPTLQLHLTPLAFIGFVVLVGSALLSGYVGDQLRASKAASKESIDDLLAGELASIVTPDPIWRRDLVRGKLYWNKKVESTFGYSWEEVPTDSRWWYEHVHPEDRARVTSSIEAAARNPERRFWSAEYRFLHRQGYWSILQDHGYVFRDNRGQAILMIGSLVDLTESRRAEQALQQSRDTLQAVLDAAPAAVVVADADGRILMSSRTTETILGAPATGSAYEPRGGYQLCHPDGSPIPGRKLPLALAIHGKAVRDVELLVIRPDATRATLLGSTTPLRSADGQVRGAVAVFQDITERKRAAVQLQTSETRFRRLFEDSPIALQISSPDGLILTVNRAWQELWHVSPEEISRHSPGGVYRVLEDPELQARGILAPVRKAFKGEACTIAASLYDPAEKAHPGRARWVVTHIYPIKHPDGSVKEVVLMHEDVTEQKQAEIMLHLLAETSELLATSLHGAATLERISLLALKYFGGCCAIHKVSEDGSLNEAVISPARDAGLAEFLRRLFQASAADTFGPVRILQNGRPEFIRRVADAFDAAHELVELLQAQGAKSYLCVPMLVRGRVWGTMTCVAIGRNYTDEELALAEQLAGRGGLALENARLFETAQKAIQLRDEFLSIASHELRTPMSALHLQVEMLLRTARREVRRDAVSPALMTGSLELALRQVDRLSKLISELMDVSRVSSGKLLLELEEVDLAALVWDVVRRFEEEAAQSGCMLVLTADEPVPGRWDRSRMEQVVTNLLTNALKFGAGKPVELTVAQERQLAYLVVRDHGIGIAPEDTKRLFNRFERATTARRFGGLGLGLYIARQIVDAHGGTIRVESQPGSGSTFTVELPLEPPPRTLVEKPSQQQLGQPEG
jgi:PAS domain S-box-containing protein